MKKLLLATCVALLVLFAQADNIAKWDPRMAVEGAVTDTNGVKWIDGRYLPLEGKMFADADHFYDRLPRNVTTNVNAGVRSMKHHTTGMQFRFTTSSPTVSFEWVPWSSSLAMDHMPATGVSCIDVYTQNENGVWRYLKTGRIRRTFGTAWPTGRLDRVQIKPNTPILVNLPLYNGVKSFRVGVEKAASVSALGPRKSGVDKPVVFYGTSITHGGCCSRPGLSFVNMIGRDLDVPVVNLGFSGSGVMEFEMSEHLAAIDASCYVLDCLWNMEYGPSAKPGRRTDANYEPFIRNLRAKRPDVPIVMAGRCDVFCRPRSDQEGYVEGLYRKLKSEGWQKLYFLSGEGMLGSDFEGTVDGCHPNDLGMRDMAKAYGGAVRTALDLRPSPESLGVSSKGVLDWIAACEKELDAVHGFVLLRHGKLVAEGSWAPYDTLNEPHMLFSHSKSFTSTAIGFLVDDGKLDLDERVADIFPDKLPAAPSENLKQLRVRDLLTMNLGAKHTDAEADAKDGDWEQALLANTIDFPPGTKFRYDSGATYLLASIVERKSGMKLMDFLKLRLFDRIGIETAWSTISPSGTACGGWGMNMTTREMAKFGQLLLQQGLWEGRRIISSEWIALATSRQTWSGAIAVAGEDGSDWHQGYGFQFWRCRHGFYRADGANGQLTVVMPQYDAVMSVHAGLGDMQKELNLIWKHIVPAMKDAPLPEDLPSADALARRCAALSIPALSGDAAGAARFCGRRFVFDNVRHGFKRVEVTAADSGWSLLVETAGGENHISVGSGRWARGEMMIDKGPYDILGSLFGRRPLAVAASGKVEADGAFRVQVRFVTGPHNLEFRFREKDGQPVVDAVLSGIGGVKFSGAAEN